jgi:hypothetical protein
MEQSAQFCTNGVQNGALLSRKFCPRKLLIKIWEFKAKISQNRELISLNFGLIFFLNEPNAKNFAQNGELSPNLVALACTEASTNTCTNAVTANWREIRKKTK